MFVVGFLLFVGSAPIAQPLGVVVFQSITDDLTAAKGGTCIEQGGIAVTGCFLCGEGDLLAALIGENARVIRGEIDLTLVVFSIS